MRLKAEQGLCGGEGSQTNDESVTLDPHSRRVFSSNSRDPVWAVWIRSVKFTQDENEIVARERQGSLSLLAGGRGLSSQLPEAAVTKHFSHANWASAGQRMKDGDVTERVNRDGSVNTHLDGKVREDVSCLRSVTFANYASRTRSALKQTFRE